jgi:type IV pilus biogenesis protein PilP
VRHKQVVCFAMLSLVAGGAMSETVADQLNVMGAQVMLLNKQQELYQALARSSGTDVASLPKVVAVYGVEGKLKARLLLPSGVVSTFEEGDVIRGAMKVAAITAKAVLIVVSNGKKVATLPLDFIAGGQLSAGGGLPGVPGQPGAGTGGPLPPELLPPPPPVGAPLPPRRPGAAPTSPAAAPASAPAPQATAAR